MDEDDAVGERNVEQPTSSTPSHAVTFATASDAAKRPQDEQQPAEKDAQEQADHGSQPDGSHEASEIEGLRAMPQVQADINVHTDALTIDQLSEQPPACTTNQFTNPTGKPPPQIFTAADQDPEGSESYVLDQINDSISAPPGLERDSGHSGTSYVRPPPQVFTADDAEEQEPEYQLESSKSRTVDQMTDTFVLTAYGGKTSYGNPEHDTPQTSSPDTTIAPVAEASDISAPPNSQQKRNVTREELLSTQTRAGTQDIARDATRTSVDRLSTAEVVGLRAPSEPASAATSKSKQMKESKGGSNAHGKGLLGRVRDSVRRKKHS